jgi:protein TonB
MGEIIMLAIRAPFSAVAGALLSVGLFLGLARLIDVPFPSGTFVPTPPPVLEQVRPGTEAQRNRDPRVEYEPPQRQPDVPDFVFDDFSVGVQRVRYTPPPIDARPGHGLGPRRFDGDVIQVVQARPEYPPRALAGNIEGWVRVRFTVTTIGTVRDAVVVESEPGTVFDEAALKAIARWRYNPRVENGEAVERVGLQTMIRFTLEN